MAGTGSYSGSPTTNADYRDSVDILLGQIPDNTSNLIKAKDVRDSVWTLWNRIEDVQIIASQSASASVVSTYDRTEPSSIQSSIGGVNPGATFSGTIQDALDRIFYPYVGPVASISASNNPRQFGSGLSVNLTWSVTKKKNSILSITVDGSSISVTGDSQNGVKTTVATHSSSPGISSNQSYSMSVYDGTSTVSSNTTLTWMNKRYWGTVDLTSIGNPNLTLSPGSSTQVGSYITDTIIKSLTSELATTKSKTYSNIDGGGKYLVFSFPTLFGTPTFIVNNLQNTAFTKVRSNSTFVNEFGFSGVTYDVWVSNTAYNSPCTIIIQ
jgi:hypothetical protein